MFPIWMLVTPGRLDSSRVDRVWTQEAEEERLAEVRGG